MTKSFRKGHDVESSAGAGHAVLERLAFSGMELAALRHNGFVSVEPRRQRAIRYKLRFRLNGRQHVRVLGTDPGMAAAVVRALFELQRAKRTDQQLRQLCRSGRAKLREGKRQLAPMLARLGVKFHGHSLRQSRNAIIPSNAPTSVSRATSSRS
jgi:hypothetical protein